MLFRAFHSQRSDRICSTFNINNIVLSTLALVLSFFALHGDMYAASRNVWMCIVFGLVFGVTLSTAFLYKCSLVNGPVLLSTVARVEHGPSRMRRRLSDCRAQDGPNIEPNSEILRPPLRYGPQQLSEADFYTLQRRVRVLEKLVGDLCGALLYSDDMSILERKTAEMGQIYRDSSFSQAREPTFSRNRIKQVLDTHGFIATQQPHRWVQLLKTTNGCTTTNATATNETNGTGLVSCTN